MPTHGSSPPLAEILNRRLLAASQLQIQATRSVALDAGALGLMVLDFAAGASFGARGAYHLGILALALLGFSFGLAVQTLRLPGAKRMGSSVTDTPEAPESEGGRSTEDSLLDDLEEDVEINEEALARRDPLFERALRFLVLAIVVALAGRL